MAAHTFAPEDALPPPKSAVIYSRDGRKRSLNIDMTKHFAPSYQSQPPTPLLPLSVNAPPSVAAAVSAAAAGSTANNHTSHGHGHPGDPSLYAIAGGNQAQSNSNGANHAGGANAPQRKKKKKRSKKKTLGRIEESLLRPGQGNSASAGFLEHEHHADCQHDHHHHGHHHDSVRHHHHHHDDEDEEDEDFFSDEETYATAADGSADHQYDDSQSTGVPSAAGEGNGSKKKKKKRKKSSTTGTVSQMAHSSSNHHNHNHGHSHANGSSSKAMVSSQSSHRNGHDHGSMVKHMHDNHSQNDGFWHYSDAEERQRIREFWFQLREEERRSLVRVEKEAVLKKMKEQQRHSCSCSLCGRKRTAIEEELELLYDAYYDELEQYANQQQPSDGHVLPYSQHSASFEDDDLSDESRGSDEEDEDEDDEDDEDDDEEGYEDDDEDDEEYEDDISNRKASFPYSNGFPNALQAKGNILTVAEDLLENDGKKFLEMMDRLADRKVQRDDELMDNRGVYEEYDDEEEGEFEDEGPEEDALTKEQRMEEGRRMFQAFAARMFEQRVLSAYREKVAQERQERLLAELEEESRQEQLREERKEREKEKKRDKKRLQRQQKEEERAAKEAQRLAEEKRLLEERERKLEADRKRREEERRVKEEEKRLREEERVKKEEERKRKLKEEKAREIEKERKRKEDLLAKEQEETARKALEASKEEALRLERETQLKQQLLEEQLRQEELRRQEQQVHEEAALAASTDSEQEISESNGATSPAVINAPSSPIRGRTTTTGSDSSAAPAQLSATQSPVSPPGMAVAPSNVHPQLVQGPMSGQMWSTPYPSQQPVPPQHFQLSHSNMQQQHHQPFPQAMQQGLFRPTNQFGQIGEPDVFTSRVGPNTGRGPFMGGSSHHNQTMFTAMNQHQLPSTPVGGLRSPGQAPVGYGASNVPGKQLLNLMSPGSSSNTHDLTSSNGSPLHSPSTLGSISAPIGSYGPISPIGHSRRTSTAHGSTSDTIKPIQRPVPIGRPKDSGAISNSFDGLNLGLSGLTIGSEMDRRSRSPPRSLGGGSLESLDGVALRKDSLHSSEGLGNVFSSDAGSLSRQMDNTNTLQQPSSSNRGQRDTSFFSNSFFGSRVNNHDPFFQGNDFLNYGQQGHGSLPNSHFLSGYPMHLPSSPQHQSQQQQLFLQQQQQYMHPGMQELQLQQQQQQLGMNSPPLNGTSGSWGRAGFMQPPLMNGVSNGSVSLGLTSPPSRALSPPPLGLHNGSHSPLLPIGPPSNGGVGSSGHLHQYNNFGGNGANGLGLTVGSDRKSVSHLPSVRNEGVSSGLEGATNGLMGTGFPPGYGAHPLQQQQQHQQQQQLHAHSQQQQQQLHAHRLGAIGEVGSAGGGLREGNFSL